MGMLRELDSNQRPKDYESFGLPTAPSHRANVGKFLNPQKKVKQKGAQWRLPANPSIQFDLMPHRRGIEHPLERFGFLRVKVFELQI